jgi:signal transduction protein with GAF and PtsI domain
MAKMAVRIRTKIMTRTREKATTMNKDVIKVAGSKFNQRNIGGTQEANMMLNLLCEVGKKVGSASKIETAVQTITQMIQHILRASASSVLLFDDGKKELFFEISEGKARRALKQMSLDSKSGIAGWVARYGKPLIVNDVTRDQRFDRSIDDITGFVTRSIICVPLVVRRKIIGVIEVLNL